MKKIVYSLFILLSTASAFAQNTPNAEITFIGNEGFMVSNNDKKIFIDGLYYYGNPGSGIMDVNENLRNMIMNDSGPFKNSSLFLITHSHPDHYSKDMTVKFLAKNNEAKLVAPSGIIAEIGALSSKDQLVGFNPKKGESLDTTLNGIELSVYNLLHDIGYRTYNLGYIANLDGFTIFHAGDNTMEDTAEYVGFNLSQKNIDVAFLNYNSFWKTEKQRAFVKKYINPKYIVLMHIGMDKVATALEDIKKVDSSFAGMIVLATSMEKVAIKDTLTYINIRPKANGKIADTTVIVNSQFEKAIPALFSDPDNNDSVTYIVRNLPAGLSFDEKTMKISGAASKAGTYKLALVGTDKSMAATEVSFTLKANLIDNVELVEGNSFTIYPNPCKNELYINNNPENSSLRIYSLQGTLVKELLSAGNKVSVNVSDLSKGTYFITSDNVKEKRRSVFVKE